MTRLRRAVRLAALCALSSVLAMPVAPASLGGQTHLGPLLAPDHWVRPVLQRLDALGALPPELDPAGDGWTRSTAGAALDGAAERARAGESTARRIALRIAESGAARLAAERSRPEDAPGAADVPLRRLPAWVDAGWRGADGVLDASFDTAPGAPPVGPVERPAVAEAGAGGRAAFLLLDRVAAEVEVGFHGGSFRLDSGHALVAWGPAGFWAGRRRLRLGPTAGRPGLLLASGPSTDALGVTSTRAVRLPGPLQWLGPVSGDMFISRLDAAGATTEPWLWGFYGSVRPHDRVRIGVERAALIGGGESRLQARDLVYLLIGKHGGEASEVDNQAVALDVWLRPPLGPVPVALYASYGIDDSAGAWRDVPAFLLAAELAAVPGIPALSVALEHVVFSGSCCGNPPWYRHLQLPWMTERQPLGHPLGGHGREWRLRARADALPAGGWTSVELFRRQRRGENLESPLREGRSGGAAAAFGFRPPDRPLELLGSASMEASDRGWSSWRLGARLRVWF